MWGSVRSQLRVNTERHAEGEGRSKGERSDPPLMATVTRQESSSLKHRKTAGSATRFLGEESINPDVSRSNITDLRGNVMTKA